MRHQTADYYTTSCDCQSVVALEGLVDDFAEAMKRKLRSKLLVDGRRGWDDPCWTIEEIREQLEEHTTADDPIDVANFAAFWWNRLGEDNV